MRVNVSSGSPHELRIGFCRAVRIGNVLAVAGTAPVAPDGSVAAPGDVRGQTRRCLQIIAAALAAAGLRMDDVIRIRVMLIDIDTWREAAKAYREFFSPRIRPACSFIEVSRFIDPRWLVEIEADGVIVELAALSEPRAEEQKWGYAHFGARP
ncbi:RidA family protein [Luteimonas sp. SJ-92]|uniref:RidA family protein n=1 Tax=Luteimonas salinisoli TaxID=2752307 RepID=A0A853JD51_9GAMM|nr:Rid family hydrolase [Luteimonas salinisoli]NZA26549.1 RidA family protein [Luteimonas salinisoli]